MNTEDKDAAVILGICVPVIPPKRIEDSFLDKRESSASIHDYNESSEIYFPPLPFYPLPLSLDPNLGILGKLPPSNILIKESTFNWWNIEPHFLDILPLATTNPCESSILLFGGLNPCSVLKNNPPDFGHEDFVLGSTIFQYILKTNVWQYYGTMIEPRCYHACSLLGQCVYVTGGYSLLTRHHCEMIATASTDQLNLEDRQWKRCASMITARAAHAAVSHKSCLYVFGGRSSQGEILSSVELYNPDKDFWMEITYIPQPTMGLSATCSADTIWILGGITSDSSDDPSNCLLSDVYSFSPCTKRWNKKPPLPQPCAFSSCVSDDQSLFLIGGCRLLKYSGKDTLVSCSSVLQLPFSAKAAKWKSVASLLHPRHATTAVLQDELIYVLGGMESSSNRASSVNEVLNMKTNTSVQCANLPVPITGCTSVVIKSNIPEYNEYSKYHVPESYDIVLDACRRVSTPYAVKGEYSLDSIKTFNTSGEYSGGYSTEYDSYNKIMKQSVGIEGKKADGSENALIRSSVEIFVNPGSANKEEVCSFTLKKGNPSVLKWLKFYDSLSTSGDKLHKRVFESNMSLKTERDDSETVAEGKHFEKSVVANQPPFDPVPSSVPDDTTSKQSFLYIQSDLKSFLPLKADLKDSEKEKSENLSEKVSSSEPAEEAIDNLNGSIGTDKISIEDCFPLILVMGGENPKNSDISQRILCYYCDKNAWEYVGILPDVRCHHSLVYLNDKIYVIGGYQAATSRLYENITKKVLCYNICDEVWSEVDCMNYSRAYHSTVLVGNEIYVIGGRDEAGNILASVEAYNESENKWRECKPLPYPVLGAAAGALNDRLYVFGGIEYEDENEMISTKTAVFDLHNDSWSQGPDMPAPLAFCGITLFSNSVWLFGGLEEESGSFVSGKDVVKFDLKTGIWSKVTKLSTARHASITVSSGSKVYIIGGHCVQDKKGVKTCKFSDLEKREILTIKKLSTVVFGSAGVMIPSTSKKKEGP